MGKLQMVDWSFDLTRDSIFAFVLFWLTDGLKSYVANQTIIQRYVSTRDESSAQRSIKASAIVGTLISWTFLLAGTGLFLFYQQNPHRFDLTVDKPDAVFPWFIVFELPPGVVGLLMTALIAAAFSSLYGALNSTSTVIVTDFYRRFAAAPTDHGSLRLGKICTIAVGLLSTGISLTLAGLSSKSLVEQTLSVIGLFGGGLGGLFLLGMLTTRVSARSALAGFVVSAAVQYYVSRHTALHWLTYMFTGMGSCFVAGWLASFIWQEKRPLDGLTVHTCA
jgi:Na+/proline symporter